MSGMQLFFLRSHGPGLYSVATNSNTMCTISRKVLTTVSTTQSYTSKKNPNPYPKIRRLKATKNLVSKEEWLIQQNWEVRYPEHSLSRQVIDPIFISNKSSYNESQLRIKKEWLPIGQGLFYNKGDNQVKCRPDLDKETYINNFSSTSVKNDTEGANTSNKDGLPNDETLERAAAVLAKELTGIFVSNPDYTIYRKDIVFENRINNKVIL